MPMSKPEDHGGGDPDNNWCRFCCNKDGSHKSREQCREGMIGFMLTKAGQGMMRKMGLTPPKTRSDAEKAVDYYMSTMPAWQ